MARLFALGLTLGILWFVALPSAASQEEGDSPEPPAGSEPATIQEVEPNDETDREGTGLPEVSPPEMFAGRADELRDRDHFVLVIEEELIANVYIEWREPVSSGDELYMEISSVRLRLSARGESAVAMAYRLPVGRHLVRLTATRFTAPHDYRIVFKEHREPPPMVDVEPNETVESAPDLTLTRDATLSARGYVSYGRDTQDWLRLTVAEAGIYQLDASAFFSEPDGTRSQREMRLEFYDPEVSPRSPLFTYDCDTVRPEFRFFPVLDATTYTIRIHLSPGGARPGEEWAIAFRAFEPQVDSPLLDEAREAIDRGLTWFLDNPAAEPERAREVIGVGGALAALGEGSGLPERDRTERIASLLDALEAEIEPATPSAEWDGQPVQRFGTGNMYEMAIVTLALADCVAAGTLVERTRPLCELGVRFLVAGQVSTWRPQAWEPVESGEPTIGGWRYRPTTDEADISVTGWCVIALFAAAVAEVEVPGLDRALAAGVRYLPFCHRGPDGYAYQAEVGRGTSAIRQAIGALAAQLFDARSPSVPVARAHVERNLAAGTQSPDPHGAENSVYYYAYYGTRLQYLRGGAEWTRWRATMIRQLLRAQSEDGSWPNHHSERVAGLLYSTGMAIVILRLCLNEPPAYLELEAEAF